MKPWQEEFLELMKGRRQVIAIVPVTSGRKAALSLALKEISKTGIVSCGNKSIQIPGRESSCSRKSSSRKKSERH